MQTEILYTIGGKMARDRLKGLEVTDKDGTRKKIDFNEFMNITDGDGVNVLKTPASKIRHEAPSPSTGDSSDSQSIGGFIT